LYTTATDEGNLLMTILNYMGEKYEMKTPHKTKLDDLLGTTAEYMPMGYARALLPRINEVLLMGLSQSERQQLLAVKEALENPVLEECKGLDRLHYFLEMMENKYDH
jgi:hypothetical protein